VAHHADQRAAAAAGQRRRGGVLAGVLEEAAQRGRLLADLGQELCSRDDGIRDGRQRSRHRECSRGRKTGAASVRSRRFSSVTSR
jgi:hypothetical protein